MTEALDWKPVILGFGDSIEQVRTVNAPCQKTARSMWPLSREQEVDIIDIREGGVAMSLASSIRQGLSQPNEDEYLSIPSLLLWDEAGLKHFEEITYNPQYYLSAAEIVILERHSRTIADSIQPGSVMLELGSGALRKTMILLQALDDQGKQVDYYALDLDRNELVRTLSQIKPGQFSHVRCHGLLGTYENGRAWLSKSANAARPRCVLSLGSTMGSFTHPEALDFWQGWSETLQQSSMPSRIIVGLDGCTDGSKVFGAYNDVEGANRRFIMNALDNANRQLGYHAFHRDAWTVEGEWDPNRRRHTQYLVPSEQVEFEGKLLENGERVFVVHSHKWTEADRRQLWEKSDLLEEATLTTDGHEYYGIHILTPTVKS